MRYFPIIFLLIACSTFEKDNHVSAPTDSREQLVAQRDLYRELVAKNLDSDGLVVMGESVGDSALFSCLARAAGATSFDPGLLFRDGRPVRHKNIAPGISKTPISKDMINGILWCLLDLHLKGDSARAAELISSFIDYGSSRKVTYSGVDVGWQLCTDEDKALYQISDEDWFGRCFLTAAGVKDVYRVAKMLGLPCEEDCAYFSAVGANVPTDGDGYKRHLAVLTTLRNGFVEGAINDNSLALLKKAAEAQPRNALYQAAYATFSGGDQTKAFDGLSDSALFPREGLPTDENYCTHYLFERDEDNADWVPCPGKSPGPGRGVEFLFAAAVALGELKK